MYYYDNIIGSLNTIAMPSYVCFVRKFVCASCQEKIIAKKMTNSILEIELFYLHHFGPPALLLLYYESVSSK